MTRAIFDREHTAIWYTFSIEGEDFPVTKFEIEEALSQAGQLKVAVLSSNLSIDLQSHIGKKAKFKMITGEEGTDRFYHGVVKEFSFLGTDEEAAHYEVTVVPRIWTLNLKYRSRVHATDSADGRDIQAVVRDVLKDSSLDSAAQFELSRNYQPYSFLNQYNESDYDFIHRILEEEGIFYYIDHTEKEDTYRFVDSSQPLQKAKPHDEVLVSAGSGDMADESELVTEFTLKHQMSFGKVESRAYDFKNATRRTSSAVNKNSKSDSQFEYYLFPAKFQDQEDAKSRMDRQVENLQEAFDAGVVIASGAGNYRSMAPGRRFKTIESPSDREWMCTSVKHVGTEGEHVDQAGAALGGGGATYEMEFTSIPIDVTYRPPRVTPRPVASSTQTATVVGPPGEEIYVDKHGRVKVHMHWDRQPKKDVPPSARSHEYDDTSSFWCRVAQPSAGKGWGIISIPRIGQEVVLTFVNGDIDEPLIVGSVWNDYQAAPYGLPDNKTRTSIKTNSSPGGNGYNEIRFEDAADGEQIFIHAQRDYDLRVLNELRESIVSNRHLTVGTEKTNADQMEYVYGNKMSEVLHNQEVIIGDHDKRMVGKSQDLAVGKDQRTTIGENVSRTVGKNESQAIGENLSMSIGGDFQMAVGGDQIDDVRGERHILATKAIQLESTLSITLKVGPSFIKLDSSGITIMGPMVKINSGGSAGPGKKAQPKSPEDAIKAVVTKATEADNDETGKASTMSGPPQ